MKTPIKTATFLAAALMTGTVAAAELKRGRDGLEEVAFTVSNTGTETLTCGATLAHWFSQPIGTAAPGAIISASLWLQRETGTVFMLNRIDDRMPVERLWCGKDGSSWKTRREVALERRKGQALEPIRLACKMAGEKAECRRD